MQLQLVQHPWIASQILLSLLVVRRKPAALALKEVAGTGRMLLRCSPAAVAV